MAAQGAVRAGPPALPRTFLDRPLLRRALDEAAGSTVTEVIGPAGSGKTLGVAGWLQRDGGPLDGEADGGVVETRWWTVTPALTVDDLRALLAAPGRVVLDNAERLSRACVRELEAFVDAARPGLRLVVLTRWDLPIRTLVPVLLGTMSVVRGDRVRLSDDEARRLAVLHAPGCPPTTLEAIVDHARGWAAAVVLAARAVTRQVAVGDGRPHAGLGDTALVGQEAFASLGPRERHVLLAVCQEVLVTGSTAVHLSQDRGALGVVQGLAETGLLVQRERTGGAHDVADDVFRVHPILLQVARRRLGAGGPEVDRALAAVAEAARVDLLRGDAGAGVRRTLESAGPVAAARVVVEHGLAAVLRGDGHVVDQIVRRCPAEVEDEPGAWLPAAVAAWFAGDLTTAALWSDRIVARSADPGPRSPGPACLAVAHLLRAQLGVEDPGSVRAPELEATHVGDGYASTERGLLRALHGTASAWAGDVGRAERDLADAVVVARTHGYFALLTDALARLACTELLRGRPTTAADLVAEALRTSAGGTRETQVAADAAAARTDPWRHAARTPAPAHTTSRDPVATYLGHVTAAQRLAVSGRVREANLALAVPSAVPALPRHLVIDLLVRRALVAAAAEDGDVLREVAVELDGLGAYSESALAAGFDAVLRSEPDDAAAALRRAVGAERSPHRRPHGHGHAGADGGQPR